MRLWQWLCATQFPDLVWKRWDRGFRSPQKLPDALTHAMSTRFLGRAASTGVSRNTLARLWWTAERTRDGDEYELARAAL